MDENIKHLLTILGFSWLLLNFSVKLRSDIDRLRNRIVYQLDKDFVIKDQETRIYMFKKDIRERIGVLIGLMVGYSAIMFFVAENTSGGCKFELCKALHNLLYILGITGLVGGVFVAYLGFKDYKKWEKHIDSTAPKGAGS